MAQPTINGITTGMSKQSSATYTGSHDKIRVAEKPVGLLGRIVLGFLENCNVKAGDKAVFYAT